MSIINIQNDDRSEQTDSARAKLWVATTGNDDGKVIRAHVGEIAYQPFDGADVRISSSPILDLQERINLERSTFSPSATFSSKAKNRKAHSGIPGLKIDDHRTNFQIDRDSIQHSQPYRRLAGKTQVYLNPDDHQRTRLTHVTEVAQIAKSIAETLRLNTVLAEAIGLGHDCGHGPGGHASEDAFDPYLPEGFNHAIFGADVTLRRLNLSEETLDGIRNHSWSLNLPKTPEAEIVSFADRIAYVCHDLEDALSCSMVKESDFPKELSAFLKAPKSDQIAFFIDAVVQASVASGTIAMTKEAGEILKAFRAFNHEHIYQHDSAKKQNEEVIEVLRGVVDFYIAHFEHLPDGYRQGVVDSDIDRTRAVIEYVAGMTDNYALGKYDLHVNSSRAFGFLRKLS